MGAFGGLVCGVVSFTGCGGGWGSRFFYTPTAEKSDMDMENPIYGDGNLSSPSTSGYTILLRSKGLQVMVGCSVRACWRPIPISCESSTLVRRWWSAC